MIKKIKLFLIAFLGTALISTPAWAGPVVIVGAVIGGAVGAAAAAAGLISATIFTGALIGAAVGGVAGALAPDLLGGFLDVPDYNVAQNAQAQNDGILVNKTGTLTPVPVVYGKRKVGGPIVYMSAGGDRNKYLYLACVLSEGEIDSIETVFLDDVDILDERFKDRYKIERFTGAANQSASTLLKEASDWTDDHRLRGLAYVALRLEWRKIESIEDSDANPYQGVPRVTAIVKGKKVKDCTGLTNSHSTAYNSETVTWSSNPADCILDYLRNPIYGKGLSNDRIDFTSFSTARAKYAQTVEYAAGGGTGPVLTCDAVIDTSRSILDNLKTFLANARSGMPYVQGKFKLKLQDTGHSTDSQNTTPNVVFAVTRDHIVGGIKLQANGTRDHYNQVKITYVDPTSDWKSNEVIYPILDSALDQTLLAEDNGKRLTKDFAFNHITNRNMAGDIGKTILNQSRNKKHISFRATAELHEAEVGDIITVTYDLLGFSSAYYRISSLTLNNDYTIDITATEHTPAEYVFDDTQVKYGETTQRKYVGGLTPGKYYYWDGSEWQEGIAPPPTANEPKLPAQPVLSKNDLKITSITVRSTS